MSTTPIDARHVALPNGTRVVIVDTLLAHDGRFIKHGTAARVIGGEHPRYEVETPSGHRCHARRDQLVIRNEKVSDNLRARAADWERLEREIVLLTVVGSQAWGLADASSDEDLRGCFVLPFADTVRLVEPPDELAPPRGEVQVWELAKLVQQGLRGDANTLEMLWSPLVRLETPEGALIRARRDLFASRRIHGTFGRYAISQLEKMMIRLEQHETEEALLAAMRSGVDGVDALVARLAADGLGEPDEVRARLRRLSHAMVDRGVTASRSLDALLEAVRGGLPELEPWRPKNAYNLLRLLHSGIRWLRHGQPLITVDDPAIRARLLAIKRREAPLEGVIAEARVLAAEMDEAAASSPLPEFPDLAAADDLVATLRTRAARKAFHLPLPSLSGRPPAEVARHEPSERHPLPDAAIASFLAACPPLDVVLCAVTGSHDYGFPSPDSDVDLKAIHLAPAADWLGLRVPQLSWDVTRVVDGVEMDWTSNEAGEVARLLVRGNGNMLERILSPYEILPGPAGSPLARRRRDELRALAAAGVHQGYHAHYAGFFRQKAKENERAPSVKGWLYAVRVAWTGVHLLETGELVADLPSLLALRPLPGVAELVAIKRAGAEKGGVDGLPAALVAEVQAAITQAGLALERARERSPLPETCPNTGDVEGWLRGWRTTPVTP